MDSAEMEERARTLHRERPSRVWEKLAGASYWTSLDAMCCDGASEAVKPALSLLELMYIRTTSINVGWAQHAENFLSGRDATSPHLIVAAHGEQGGLRIAGDGGPASAGGLTPLASPESLRNVIDLPGRTVITFACHAGNEQLAETFLDGGCKHYIAPEGPPFFHSGPMFTSLFFFELTHMASERDAVERVAAYHPEFAQWRIFSA